MLKTSTFQLQIICPGCNNNIALSGIKDFDTCQNCGKHVVIGEEFYNNLFGSIDKFTYMNSFLSGNVSQIGGGSVGKVGDYKLTYSSMAAYCEECETVLEEQLIRDSINSGHPLTCTKCSHRMPVRIADESLRKIHPKAIGAINDSGGKDFSEKTVDKTSMVVFGCMTCGGALQLAKETMRTIKCNFCGNENYLPDTIWTKLHPNEEAQPVFLIIELDESDFKNSIQYFLDVTIARIYAKHFENFICEYFSKPFVTDAFKSWLKYFLSAENNSKISFNMDVEKLQKYFLEQYNFVKVKLPVDLIDCVSTYNKPNTKKGLFGKLFGY